MASSGPAPEAGPTPDKVVKEKAKPFAGLRQKLKETKV